jgi:hypothetical protein
MAPENTIAGARGHPSSWPLGQGNYRPAGCGESFWRNRTAYLEMSKDCDTRGGRGDVLESVTAQN